MATSRQLLPNGRERLLHLPGHGWDEVHVVIHTLGHAGLFGKDFLDKKHSQSIKEKYPKKLSFIKM